MSNSPSRAGSPSNSRVDLIRQQDSTSGASGGAMNIAGVNTASDAQLSTQDLHDPSYIQTRDAQVARMIDQHAPGGADSVISLENLLTQGALLGDHAQNIWGMPVIERNPDGSLVRNKHGKVRFSVSTFHPGMTLRETFAEVIDLQSQGYEGYDDVASDLTAYWANSADIKITKEALTRNGFKKVEQVPKDIKAIVPDKSRLYSLDMMVNGQAQTAYWFEGVTPREMLVLWHEENLSEILQGMLPPAYPLPADKASMPQGYAKTAHKMRIDAPVLHPNLSFTQAQLEAAGFDSLDDGTGRYWWSPEEDDRTLFLWDPTLSLRLNREQILKTIDQDPLTASEDPNEVHRYPSAEEVATKLLNEVGTAEQKAQAQLDTTPVSLIAETYTSDELKRIGFKRTDSTPQELKNLGITRLYKKVIPSAERTTSATFHEWMVDINEARIARIQAGRPDPERASVSETAELIRASLAASTGAGARDLPPDDDDDRPGPSDKKPSTSKPHSAPESKKSDKKSDDDSASSGKTRVPQLTYALRFSPDQLDELQCFGLDVTDATWIKAKTLIEEENLVCFYPIPGNPHFYLWGANNQTVGEMQSITERFAQLTQDQYLLSSDAAARFIYQGAYGDTPLDTSDVPSIDLVTPSQALSSTETFSSAQLMRIGFNLVLRTDDATSYSLAYHSRMRQKTADDGRHHLWAPNAALEEMRDLHKAMVDAEAATGINMNRLHPEETLTFIKSELAKLPSALPTSSFDKKDDDDGDDKPDSKKDRSDKAKSDSRTEPKATVEELITPSTARVTGDRDLTDIRRQLRTDTVEETVIESRFVPLIQPDGFESESSDDEGDIVDVSLTRKRFDRVPSPDVKPKLKAELLASWSKTSGLPVSTALRTYQASMDEFVDVSEITGIEDPKLSDYSSESELSFGEEDVAGLPSKFKTIDSSSDSEDETATKTAKDFFEQYGAGEPPPDAIYTRDTPAPAPPVSERPAPMAPPTMERLAPMAPPTTSDKPIIRPSAPKTATSALTGKYGRRPAPSAIVTRTQQKTEEEKRATPTIDPKTRISIPSRMTLEPKEKAALEKPSVKIPAPPAHPTRQKQAEPAPAPEPVKKPVTVVKKDTARPRKVSLGKKAFTATVPKKPPTSDGVLAPKSEVKSLVSPAAMMAALKQERGAALPTRLTAAQLRDPKFVMGEAGTGSARRAYSYRRPVPGAQKPVVSSSDESDDGMDIGAYAAKLKAEAQKKKEDKS